MYDVYAGHGLSAEHGRESYPRMIVCSILCNMPICMVKGESTGLE